MEGDDMDSLFEGMVLFTPPSSSQSFAPPDRTSEVAADDDAAKPTPAPITVSTDSMNSNDGDSPSQPLDENLFSDLTLVTPEFQSPSLDNPQRSSSSSPASIAPASVEPHPIIIRQVSRKKKRASGLKIGYGRVESRAALVASDEREIAEAQSEAVPVTDSISARSSSSETTPIVTIAQSDQTHPAVLESSQSSASLEYERVASPSPIESISEEEKESAVPDVVIPSALSTEEKFEQIKAQISLKLKGARELAASVSAAKKDAIRKRRKAADDLNAASVKYRELEKQLEDACEAEDFETADKVSNSLADVEMEKASLMSLLREAELECDSLDLKMQEVIEQQIALEEECVLLLKEFSTDAAKDAESLLKEAESESSKEMDHWYSTNEELEANKMELEIETHLINDAKTAFNDSLDSLIDEEKREMQVLFQKKDILTEELERLLALVKEKEKEIAENDCKIKIVEEKIAGVVSGFQDTHLNIEAKFNKLQSSLLQMESESKALMMKKKEIDDFIAKEQDKCSGLLELSRLSAHEAKIYEEELELQKCLMTNFLKSSEHRAQLVKAEGQLTEDLLLLRHEVSTARSSLQELSSAKSSIQQDIASSKQRIFFIDKRVPELEAEKKVAAAARNFKEAARITAEAKALIVDREDGESKIKEATLELEKLEEQIKETVNRLQETEILILSKEKEVAFARFQRLLLVAGSAIAERTYALELGDIEEAKILLAEAEAADSEAKALEPIYDFKKDELTDLPKHFISMELVSNLHRTQMTKLAKTVDLATS